MHSIDWLIIVIYLVFSIGVALFFTRRSGKDTESYFLSGRRLPWWLAGSPWLPQHFAR